MLFLLYLFMVCFSQVGFAGDGPPIADDGSPIGWMGEEVLTMSGQRSTLNSAYAVDAAEVAAKQAEAKKAQDIRCQRNWVLGCVATAGTVLAGGVVTLVGYCIWQEPRLAVGLALATLLASAY